MRPKAWKLFSYCIPLQTIHALLHSIAHSLLVIASCSTQAFGASFCPTVLPEGDPSSRIATVYCHGYEDSGTQARHYLSLPKTCVRTSLLPGLVVTFDFADAGRNPFRFNRAQCSMGQHNEIERVHAAIQYAHTLDVDKIVVYGVSRGATALIGALGKYGNTYEKVCAAVLESPFADLQDVISHIHRNIRYCISRDRFTTLFRALCAQNWDSNGSKALDFIADIPEHIAIQFIATNTDKLVPISSTKKLYQVVSNRDNSYLHAIYNGRHGHLIKRQTARPYAHIVDTFYQHHLTNT